MRYGHTIIVRRLKGSNDSTHYLERDELAGLKVLQRHYAKQGIKSAWVFVNERGKPFGRMGTARMIERAGEAAKLPLAEVFIRQMTQLVDRIKATPRQAGIDEIRIPSERAFRSRERALREGLTFDRLVFDALVTLRERRE